MASIKELTRQIKDLAGQLSTASGSPRVFMELADQIGKKTEELKEAVKQKLEEKKEQKGE